MPSCSDSFFFSSRRRHTRFDCDWSSDVCSSDLPRGYRRSEHHGVHFSYTHEGSGLALCEPRWVRRVLLNLLSNAINASPEGGDIRLRSLSRGELWRVEIEDEGGGVPSSEREHIFDRFVRLKSAARPKLEGSGLGLAICRGIIELHKGRIMAEVGSGGRGLRVAFEIPAQTPAPRAPNLSPDALAPATSRWWGSRRPCRTEEDT